jgi:glycosyltransferase involved in cell wall biosynthesis
LILASNTEIRVSIGLPVRNGGEQLKAALNSILNQTEQNFEIVVSDNGSFDDTEKYVRSLAEYDQRIRYFRQDPPIRAYDNFHYVLNQARGEYFMWAAHDDTRDNDYIEYLVKELESCPEAVLAFGDLNVITPENPRGSIRVFPFQTIGIGRLRRLAKIARLQCYYIYGVWKTSAIKKVPYAYCAWWPDLPMMLAAANLGTFNYVAGTRFNYLEIPKSNLDRVKVQDYKRNFNLPIEVAGLVVATFKACQGTGNISLGIYAAGLVVLKQLMNIPGYVYRRLRHYFK